MVVIDVLALDDKKNGTTRLRSDHSPAISGTGCQGVDTSGRSHINRIGAAGSLSSTDEGWSEDSVPMSASQRSNFPSSIVEQRDDKTAKGFILSSDAFTAPDKNRNLSIPDTGEVQDSRRLIEQAKLRNRINDGIADLFEWDLLEMDGIEY
jgi:hypothetical protein